MRLFNRPVTAILCVLALVSLTNCEDTAKKKAEAEKARQDSIARADSIAKAESEAAAANAPKDIVVFATENAKTLASAVQAAGLDSALKGAGPFTVFAPTDSAFAAIQKEVDNLLKAENKAKLQAVLKHHVVAGAVKAADLKDGQEVTTLEGTKLKVSIKDGKVMVGGALVIAADEEASNGVIHVINKVLIPKK
jgi:uncharacterized surface protein with fasciclin (FAS1) repeats